MKTPIRTLILNVILFQLAIGPLLTSQAQATPSAAQLPLFPAGSAQQMNLFAAPQSQQQTQGHQHDNNTTPHQLPLFPDQHAASQPAQQLPLFNNNHDDHSVVTADPNEAQKAMGKLGPAEQEVLKQFQSTSNGFVLGGQHNFLSGWMNLAAGMGMSEFFGVLLSGDGSRVHAYFEQMTSVEFWTQMAVFEAAMGVSRSTMATILRRPGGDLGFFNHMILPMGDFITNTLMGIYQDPHMQAMIRTWDPHTLVRDPDNAKAAPTNDPAIRMKVRRQLRIGLAAQILVDQRKTKPFLGNFYHAFQMGMVAWSFGVGQQRAMMLFRSEITKDGAQRILMTPAGVARLLRLSESGASKFEFTVMKSVSLARFTAWMEESASIGAKVVAGSTGFLTAGASTALFFLLDHITTDVVQPLWKGHVSKRDVAKAQESLDSAISWYSDPNRKETLPMSRLATSNEKTMLQFFLNGGNYESEEFKSNKGGWHENYNSMFGQPWKQIFKFMSEVNEQYLGGQIDDNSFYSCFELPATFDALTGLPSLINARRDTSMCYENWVRKNTPIFIENLKKFQPIDYVQARANDVFTSYETYRNSVILAPMWETWQRWSKDLEGRAQVRSRKDQWFEWIAAGMQEDDPAFIENTDAWHPHISDAKNFWIEKVNYVIAFDREVLHMENNPSRLGKFEQAMGKGFNKVLGLFSIKATNNDESFQQRMDCGGREPVEYVFGKIFHNDQWTNAYHNCVTAEGDVAFKNHEMNVANYLAAHNQPVTYQTLYPMIHFIHTDAFRDSADVTKNGAISAEAASTVAKLLKNRFAPAKPEDEDESQKTNTMEERRHVVRWFWQGMAQTDEFTANEGNWRHVGAQDEDSFLSDSFTKYFIQPFFNQSQAPYNKQVFEQLSNDLIHVLHRDGQPIADESRNRILLVATTFAEIEKEHDQMATEIKFANGKYICGINNIAHERNFEARTIDSIRDFWSNLVDDNWHPKDEGALERALHSCEQPQNFDGETLFNRDGLYNLYLTHDGRVNHGITLYNTNLPMGTINAYNMEMGFYLSRLRQALEHFQVSDAATPANPEYNGLSNVQPAFFTTMAQFVDSMAALKTDPLFNLNDGLINQSVDATFNDAVLLYALSTDPKAKQIAQGIAQELHAQAKDVGLNDEALWTSNIGQNFITAARARNAVASEMKNRVAYVETEIKRRGDSRATEADETKLLQLLGSANFAVPLLGITAGADTTYSGLVRTLASRIINTENQKVIQARVGCFMLNDPACESNKRARGQ